MSIFQSGANIDTRPQAEKEKDFLFEEIVAMSDAVHWIEKKQNQLRSFPDIDQAHSGSCVAQTIAKMAMVHLWLNEQSILPFSATSIYTHRSNKPQGGMIGVEAFDIWRKHGITLEALVPSQKMGDQAMDAQKIEDDEKEIAQFFAIKNHIGLDTRDIETVASVIQRTKKPVMVWYYFNHDEWSLAVPEKKRDINLYAATTSRHSVTAVDFTLLPDGRKALVIEDSSHFGGHTRRFITEDFHRERNFFARYGMNFRYGIQPAPQIPAITKTLRFSDRGEQVVYLQRRLQVKGFFPINVDTTGYFGAITTRAVKDFQKVRGLVVDGIVGRNTRAELNE